jgi:hypothetical protein
MEDINISEIYQNALTDPTLFSSLDVETLLDKIENQNNHYLDNKTVEIIAQDIFVSLQQLNLSNALYTSFCQRLTGYRVIERVCDLRNGKNTRWIKRTQIYTNKSLTNGGILTNIKITNNGVQLLCMTSNRRFFNILYDDCIIFQNLSMEEQLILMSHEYSEN